MKKYAIYIGILLIGLLLGWFLFGGSSIDEAIHSHNETIEKNQLWTCSMHPQIMQQEAGDCPICGMDLIPMEIAKDGLAVDQFKLTRNAMALANIQTSIVGEISSSDNTIELSGKIVINEDKIGTQPAHFDGRIEKLLVKSVGERVKKGQAIAQIYSPILVAAQQELITAYGMREQQPQLYKAVRNKFKNWNIHDTQLTEIETTGKVKSQFTIYSHVAGIISEILVSQGAHIMDGHPIFKVANLSTVWANFDVFENQISQIKIGQEIIVSSNAYPNKEYKAKVSFIDPILDTKTRTVIVRVVLNNKTNEFKPGMFVKGQVGGIKSGQKQVLHVPSTAVLWTGKRSVVYVKSNSEEPVFEMREVVLGNNIGGNYEVLEGLNTGDEIVTNGTFTVDAAAQLQGKKSMMNKDGGKVTTRHEGHLDKEIPKADTITDDVAPSDRVEVPAEFQKQLQAIYKNYLNLKNVLIEDDVKAVRVNANLILANLEEVNMKLLPNSNTHSKWMTLEKEIKISVKALATSSELKKIRSHFKEFSSTLIKAVLLFGIDQKVYSHFCPMADGNKGANWLSEREKVVNPYFGGAMLSCGSVKQVIE